MASIPDNGDGDRSPPLRLGEGTFTDPRGALGMIWARSHFVNAINRLAPHCVDDLFDRLPACALEPDLPVRFVDPVAAQEAINDWCRHWNLGASWMRSRAIQSLLACHPHLLGMRGADRCERLLLDQSSLMDDAELTAVLEGVNPGWQDDGYPFEVVVRGVWRPTLTQRGAVWHEGIDVFKAEYAKQLDAIEAQVEATGAKKTPRPLTSASIEWTVRERVKKEPIKAIARSAELNYGAVLSGIRRVEEVIALPRIKRSGRGGRPARDTKM